eukprot:4794349-Pyramimonas_sp.AAC.1
MGPRELGSQHQEGFREPKQRPGYPQTALRRPLVDPTGSPEETPKPVPDSPKWPKSFEALQGSP